MPTIARKNGVLHYDVRGDGEPIVILRGLGRTVRHWLGWDAQLAKTFRVITLDLRGVGKSTVAHGWNATMYDVADDVADVMTAAGVEKAHILGVSLGGMVTLAMGLRHPDRCLSLITVNTSIAGQRTLRMSVPGALGIVEGALRQDGRLHRNLAKFMVGPDCAPADVERIAQDYAKIAAEDGDYRLTVMQQLVSAARFDVRRRLKDCVVPTLVVYGANDAFVPNENSRKLVARIPNARLLPVEGGGHELTLDKGAELIAILTEWTRERAAKLAR